MLYKASTSTNILIKEKMGTTAPIAIGTRGTVGSLVRREIEYFRRLERDCGDTSKKLEAKTYVGVSRKTTSLPTSRVKTASLGSLLSMSWRKKRRSNNNCSSNSSSNNNSSSFLPSMCSAVDVSESKRFGGFSYRSLKTDVGIDP
ncbi:uncharacterized protein LOC110687342 [Chenopodium quinoa]|uniref:uncharacterized protein LOC110687342 n=1 Tax=Chenopodium quinoa TaxID=63459 RepID=UPI000B796FB4|nr:uncharacterized protein LOC110687342 [Chenopodium quinoa]